jgi:hypothetical protein
MDPLNKWEKRILVGIAVFFVALILIMAFTFVMTDPLPNT